MQYQIGWLDNKTHKVYTWITKWKVCVYSEIKNQNIFVSWKINYNDQFLIASCYLNYQEAIPFLSLRYQVADDNECEDNKSYKKYKGITGIVLTKVSWFVFVFFVNKTVSKEFYSVITIVACTCLIDKI